jgi:ATP-dependent RNA helicase DHX57
MPSSHRLHRQATSKIFIRDSSMVTPYALILFGAELSVDLMRGRIDLGGDGWALFSASCRVAALVSRLRAVLDAAIAIKLEDPSVDLTGHPVVQALHRLLAFEL